MIGGTEPHVTSIRPLLEEISTNITLCGEIGAGQVMKLINNTISTCNRCALLEGLTMGLRNGLDLATMHRVLNTGGAASRLTERMLPGLVSGVPDSFFLLSLMLKDLNLATELAIASGTPLQFGHMARALLQSASHALGPGANLFALSDHLAALAGTSFTD